MCPFSTKTCGKTDSRVFEKAGDRDTFESSLLPGDVCVYSVAKPCGSPAYKVKGDSLAGIQVFDVDYDDADITNFFTAPSGIVIPSNNTSLTPSEIKEQYYQVNFTSFYLSNGT